MNGFNTRTDYVVLIIHSNSVWCETLCTHMKRSAIDMTFFCSICDAFAPRNSHTQKNRIQGIFVSNDWIKKFPKLIVCNSQTEQIVTYSNVRNEITTHCFFFETCDQCICGCMWQTMKFMCKFADIKLMETFILYGAHAFGIVFHQLGICQNDSNTSANAINRLNSRHNTMNEIRCNKITN